MTRSIRGPRRAAALLAVAATAVLMAGCSAGQIAETAVKVPSVPGVNAELRTSGGSYKIRNLAIAYRGIDGYQAGENAPFEVAIFNDTEKAVTVRITSDGARSVVRASSATSSPSPTDTAAPAEPPAADEPVSIQIPALGFVLFGPTSNAQLELTGLNKALRPGEAVNMVFDFDGERLTTEAPVNVPLSPPPAAPPVSGRHG